LKKFETYVPNQDRNKAYLGKRLGEITTVAELYQFTYDYIIQRVRSADVIWFNIRKMPYMLFEVEHSTDIKNSLSKFVELQDFYTDFCIVADEVRKREFQAKMSLEAFKPISKRVRFWNYEDVAEFHTKTSEFICIEQKLGGL